MCDCILTKKIMDFQKTGKGLQDITENVAKFVYRYPKRQLGWDADMCSDFFTWFFPKIPDMVRRFEYKGSSFFAYLKVTLTYQLRSFAREKQKDEQKEYLLYMEERRQLQMKYLPTVPVKMEVAENFKDLLKVEDGIITAAHQKRRILMLYLKAIPNSDLDAGETIARITGYPVQYINRITAQVREIVQQRVDRRNRLLEKRASYYQKLMLTRSRLDFDLAEWERVKLQNQLGRYEKVIARSSKKIAAVTVSPSHREISRILDLPKGSVDSAIYLIKQDCEKVLQKTKGVAVGL